MGKALTPQQWATMDIIFKHLQSVNDIKEDFKKLDSLVNNKLDTLITYVKPRRKFGLFRKIENLEDFEAMLSSDEEYKDFMVSTS